MVLVALSACKGKDTLDGSRTKTLDSIASGVLNIEAYQCRGSATTAIDDSRIVFDKSDPKKIDDAKKSEIRRAVRDYFSALPPSAESLFLKLGGQVMISSRSSELCQNAHFGKSLDASQGEVTDGCFNYVSDPRGKSTPIFTVVQSPDAKKIRYYGPQIFGYLYAQFYSRLALAPDGKRVEITGQETMTFISQKERVANAFLNDLLAMKDYKFDALKNILGKNVATELSSGDTLDPLDRLTALRDSAQRSQFIDYVYANSFQSAHCNSTSLEVAKTKFKLSSDLFSENDAAILYVSNLLMGVPSSPQSSQASSSGTGGKGFALAGGDFFASLMPIFDSLKSKIGGAGGAGGNGISGLFSSLLNGVGGGGIKLPTIDPQGGLSALQDSFGGLFDELSSGGCSGGNCGGCSGGSCSGGSCSNCPNGSCGAASGSCATLPG